MIKILLCGLKYDKNFGDSIINDCCKYIIKNEIFHGKEVIIKEVDLAGKRDFDEFYSMPKNFSYYFNLGIRKVLSVCNKILKKIHCKNFASFIEMIHWNFSTEKMILDEIYKKDIIESDVIVFVGGGMLKYKYQNCYQYINYVTKMVNKINIPVYLNAVGVEGIDLKNPKCKLLKKAINRNCVKVVTTRDDIETLKKYVSNEEIIYNKVSDPAVYISKVYNIMKNENSNIIGLGVCRKNLFLDNGINIDEEDLLTLWKNIIDELNNKNIKWNIYTNGLDADNEFALKFINKFNIDKSKLLIPNSPKELVKIISNFKGVVATRLHSCIVSYSLNIPAVGLVWNSKLKMFGESIDYSERFIEKENFDSKYIVNQLLNSLNEGYTSILPEDYIKTEIDSLKKFFKLYYNDGVK